MKVEIGIPEKDREGVVELLNVLLSDEYVLYTKTRNYHWNVVGPQFNDLHKFFEAQYEALNDVVDSVAERARALDGRSFGSLGEFPDHTRLRESLGEQRDARTILEDLLRDHEAIIRSLRDDQEVVLGRKDIGTNDFLVGLMEKHEKMTWMLRAFLEGRFA